MYSRTQIVKSVSAIERKNNIVDIIPGVTGVRMWEVLVNYQDYSPAENVK
jgi:hypothetical protein